MLVFGVHPIPEYSVASCYFIRILTKKNLPKFMRIPTLLLGTRVVRSFEKGSNRYPDKQKTHKNKAKLEKSKLINKNPSTQLSQLARNHKPLQKMSHYNLAKLRFLSLIVGDQVRHPWRLVCGTCRGPYAHGQYELNKCLDLNCGTSWIRTSQVPLN